MVEPKNCTHARLSCEACDWENGYDTKFLAAHRIGRFAPKGPRGPFDGWTFDDICQWLATDEPIGGPNAD